MVNHDNIKKIKYQPASSAGSGQPGTGKSVNQLKDNRPGSIVQKKLADSIIAKNLIQKKENKTGLPDNLKSGIENLSGHSMDDVKVHYNSSQPAQLNAHAYAQGTDIHIAPGQEKHLPHEAWHVVQQKQGRVKPTTKIKEDLNINDDKGLEKEADLKGEKAYKEGLNVADTTQFSLQGNFVIQRRIENEDDIQAIKDRLRQLGVQVWEGRYVRILHYCVVNFDNLNSAFNYINEVLRVAAPAPVAAAAPAPAPVAAPAPAPAAAVGGYIIQMGGTMNNHRAGLARLSQEDMNLLINQVLTACRDHGGTAVQRQPGVWEFNSGVSGMGSILFRIDPHSGQRVVFHFGLPAWVQMRMR